MGPGPSNPYPEVMQALARPVLGHLDPEFLTLLDSTNDRLRQVFATRNALTLPVSGTGSAGMEASFVNFVRPGDPVVIGVNGVFGERMCEVADRLGAHGAGQVRRGGRRRGDGDRAWMRGDGVSGTRRVGLRQRGGGDRRGRRALVGREGVAERIAALAEARRVRAAGQPDPQKPRQRETK